MFRLVLALPQFAVLCFLLISFHLAFPSTVETAEYGYTKHEVYLYVYILALIKLSPSTRRTNTSDKLDCVLGSQPPT